MPSIIIWIVTIALVAMFAFLRLRPVKGLRNMAAGEFQTALQQNSKAMLIDVREPNEFARGHIEGAVNMPLSHLASRSGSIPRDKTLFLYCQSGIRSQQAGRMLSGKGFTELVNLRGGISAWRGPVKS